MKINPRSPTFETNSEIAVELCFQNVGKRMQHDRLLKGRFTVLLVPVHSGLGLKSVLTSKPFSGGGGIDYSGKTGLEYRIDSPDKPGDYYLFANAISTKLDIHTFLIMAKGKPSGPLWTGSMVSPPVLVSVVEPETESGKVGIK